MPDALERLTHQERHRTIEEIFSRVISIPVNEQAQLLEQLCNDDTELRTDIQSLIHAANASNGFLSDAPVAIEQIFADKLNPDSMLDERFGPYRLLQVLERGGMGVVYLAERADGHYEEKVAIKFANYKVEVAGLMERFARERQILAQLRHPHVARLLDAGTSVDGYPYLVMEYVSGQAIDTYCKVNSLSIRQILALMQSVCNTVQHAHQNLIVHCDLKPDNILVTGSGSPTLLDFGIAQLLDPMRECTSEPSGSAFTNPMTPAFAAPEQITGGAITTATDVFALGNILYRLLAGVEPQYLSSSAQTLSRSMQANVPQLLEPSKIAPCHLRKSVRGDLDNIVLRALGHDPATRYSSAQALSDDIGHFLSGHAVTATRSSIAYKTGKYLRRHKLGAALTGIVILSSIAGVTGTLVQSHNAKVARVSAENRLNEIRMLANTIVFELPQTIGALSGSTPLRERLLNRGVAYLDRLAGQQPGNALLQELATAYFELAKIQGSPMNTNLGDHDSALANFKKSISIQEHLLSSDTENHDVRIQLATNYLQMSGIVGSLQNKPAEARALTDKCLELIEPVPATWPGIAHRTLGCLTLSANWANKTSDTDAAAAYLVKAENFMKTMTKKGLELSSNETHRLSGRIHEEWAQIYSVSGNPAIAAQHENQRLSEWQQISTDYMRRSRLLGAAFHGLAARLSNAGDHLQALTAYRKALLYWQQWRERYPADKGASHAHALVHAELADFLWKNYSLSTHRQLACQHYQSSVASLDLLDQDSWSMPRRYLWSPTSAMIKAEQRTRCGVIENPLYISMF